jgi:hypothetical protein
MYSFYIKAWKERQEPEGELWIATGIAAATIFQRYEYGLNRFP